LLRNRHRGKLGAASGARSTDTASLDYLFLPDFTQSRNVGFAMKKDEPRMQAAINQALLDIEASGEAVKIWDAWFGPGAEQPMKRTFRITAEY
jgi:polar amino acid transport system substrate-binding protein